VHLLELRDKARKEDEAIKMPTEKGKVSKVHIDEGKNRYGLLVNTKWYGGGAGPPATHLG